MSEIRHIVLQWPRLGPYHLARLRALGQVAATRGIAVTALETARHDTTYAAIRVDGGGEGFERITLFPDAVFDNVPAFEIRSAVHAALNRLQPDAVGINSYSLPDAMAALEWARIHRRVAIGMTDSKADDAPRMRWRERLKARLIGQFDALLLAGSPQTRYFRSLGFGGPIKIGYDVVDNAHFGSTGSTALTEPHFVASNRFIERKNLGRLIDAHARYHNASLSSGQRPWPLVLLGDGPQRADLEKRSRENGSDVRFAGFAQIEHLPALYASAAAFVHPTMRDTWGLVVNEAMAASLPVLVSSSAGCAEDLVVDGVTGWTFDPLSVEAMAEVMSRMASLPESERRAMGAAAQRHIEAWSPERFAHAFLSLADAGRETAARGLDPLVGGMLRAIRRLSRSHTTFHIARD